MENNGTPSPNGCLVSRDAVELYIAVLARRDLNDLNIFVFHIKCLPQRNGHPEGIQLANKTDDNNLWIMKFNKTHNQWYKGSSHCVIGPTTPT